jgi:hypothetical protein
VRTPLSASPSLPSHAWGLNRACLAHVWRHRWPGICHVLPRCCSKQIIILLNSHKILRVDSINIPFTDVETERQKPMLLSTGLCRYPQSALDLLV